MATKTAMIAAAATANAARMIAQAGVVVAGGGPIGVLEVEVWVLAMLVSDMLIDIC